MGFFSSGFGRILAGVGTMGMSEALLNPAMQAAFPAIGSAIGKELGSPVGGAVGGAFGSSAQSLLGGGSNASDDAMWGAWMQNQASAAQAQKQMDFQERMSNTAHQREVADLRAAGLNPILSGTGGHGSTTPAGASAPQVDIMSGKVSTALKLAELQNQTSQVMSQIALNNSQATKNISESNFTDQKTKTEKFFNFGVDQFFDWYQKNKDLIGDSLNSHGKYISESSTAYSESLARSKQAEFIEAQTKFQNSMKDLVEHQTLTEIQKERLTKGSADQVAETLHQLKNEGKVSQTKFAEYMTYFDRFMKSINPLLSLIPWFKPNSGKSMAININNN